MRKLLLLSLFLLYFFRLPVFAQSIKDSSKAKPQTLTDTTKKRPAFNPHIATIRSAILPGWGQIYNKKYWKLPLVYGALGTTAGVFFYNIKNYRLLRKAYILITDSIPSNDTQIDPRFKNLDANSIRVYRNSFRQNVDYSVLYFYCFLGAECCRCHGRCAAKRV